MNREYSRGIAQEIMFGGRINSTFAGHYDLAAYSVIMLNVLFGVFVGLKHGWSKFFTWLGILAAFWLLVASASRISVLAYFSSITLTLWFLKRKLWIVPVLAVSLIFSSFAPGLVSRSMDTLKLEFAPRLAAIKLPEFNYLDRFHPQPTVTPLPTPTPKPTAAPTPDARPASSGSQPVPTPTPTQVVVVASTDETAQQVVTEDRSTAIRFNAEWPRALRAFYKNPLLGTGYSSITLATDNDYLRQLGEIGLLGLGAFILIFLHLYQKSWPIIKKGPKDFWTALIIGIAGGILGLQANALFIDVFAASKIAIYFWLLAGIMMGTINLITINRNS
jgi:O-antigen ligase